MARTFSASQIIELIQAMRLSGDIPEAELAGMQKLGGLLKQLEEMTDADVEEQVKRYVRRNDY